MSLLRRFLRWLDGLSDKSYEGIVVRSNGSAYRTPESTVRALNKWLERHK